MRQFYLAGAYTAETDAERLKNIERAMVAGLFLLERKAWFPIIPHCSMNHTTDWPTAMAICCATVSSLNKETDCVVMMPGWERSKGATEERELAIGLGIPVYELTSVIKPSLWRRIADGAKRYFSNVLKYILFLLAVVALGAMAKILLGLFLFGWEVLP